MASRFGVDISNVGRGFQDLVQSWNLVGEQRRVQAEREAQQEQALLSLAGAAAGAFIPGVSAVAGAQMGLGAAQLLGPRPNIGAGASMLLGGADRMQRDDALQMFGKAVNPPETLTPGEAPEPGVPDRQMAAGAATKLGDIGTAARLAFPGQAGGSVNRQVVTVMGTKGPELRLLDKDTAQFVGDPLGPAEGRTTTSGNTVQEIYDPDRKVTERILFNREGEEIRVLGRVTPKGVSGKRTTVKTFDAKGKPLTALVDTEDGEIIETFPRKLTEVEGGGGGTRTATNAVDLVGLQIKAAQQAARKSGKQGVLKVMADAGSSVEALQKVGELNQRDIEREYMNLLEAETKSKKPEAERAVAQAELTALKKVVSERTALAKQAKDALGKAATKAQKDAIIADAMARGLLLSDLGLSGLLKGE
jgi:hypothetical protein